MRVLTFLHSHEPGGVERIALRLVRRWRSLGEDAALFMGRLDGAMATGVGAGLAPIVPRQPRLGSAWWETGWMMLTLPREMRRLRPDVLFCAGNTYAVVALFLKLRLGRDCPPIVAKVSNDLDRRDASPALRIPYRAWLRLQGRFLDQVVGMDEPARAEIAQAMGLAARDVAIVPDPALSAEIVERLAAAPPRGHPSAPGRRFVAVGRLAPQKNLALMLRAFRRGAGPADRLTLIGDGRDRRRLEALARKLLIADRVVFAGHVDEPTEQLAHHDVLLLSSDYEGVPAVVLEALAANLAIVATDCSRSMANLLQDGALGTLVAVGDEAGFAAAIGAARRGVQDRGATLAQVARFTVERAADAYLDVMRATVARRSALRTHRRRPSRSPFRRAAVAPHR